MPGLAEILDENARLRRELAALQGRLDTTEGQLESTQGQLETTQGQLEATQGRLETTEGELTEARAELVSRDAMLEEIKRRAESLAQQLELAELRRAGPASQRYVPEGQGQLPFASDVPPPPRAPVADAQSDEEVTEPPQKRSGGKPRRRNRDDFAHFPAKAVHCPAAEASCPSCGGPLRTIGTASSFRIEWVPGHFERHDIARDKCACPNCPGQGVLTVSGPYALDKAMAANGLVARVIVDKFADHIPANRQVRRMDREGFEVGSHTLSAWICAAAGLLQVVARAIRTDILSGAAIQGDDTGLPVQDGGDGQLRKGRMWAFTDQDQVFYAFTESKHGTFPNELLDGYAGRLLLVDGGSEFNEVVRERRLVRAGCWSHLRTYFFEALHHHPAEADLALGTLRDLFKVERDVWGQPAAAVLAERQARSRPLVDGFFDWVRALSQLSRPQSTLGVALGYAQNQESELRQFLEHGELPLHNNLSELMLRQTVVGRKNEQANRRSRPGTEIRPSSSLLRFSPVEQDRFAVGGDVRRSMGEKRSRSSCRS